MSWKLLILFALGVAVVLAPVLIDVGRSEPDTPPETTTPPQAPAEAPPPVAAPEQEPAPEDEPLVTWDEFQALRAGMTYHQVIDIVGEVETETNQVYDEGVAGYTSPSMTVWYIWKNPDRSYAKLGFISDKLRRKKQEGLNPVDSE